MPPDTYPSRWGDPDPNSYSIPKPPLVLPDDVAEAIRAAIVHLRTDRHFCTAERLEAILEKTTPKDGSNV